MMDPRKYRIYKRNGRWLLYKPNSPRFAEAFRAKSLDGAFRMVCDIENRRGLWRGAQNRL